MIGDLDVKPAFEQSALFRRKPQLDFLRGIAILLVLGHHIYFQPPLSPLEIGLFGWWLFGGWTGVDMFFVLSGYLVSSLVFNEYLKRGSIDPRNFLIRRGFKIYPGYYFFLLTTIPLLLLLRVSWQPINLLHEALFVQNYLGGIWPHLWSLAVEEHFYIAFCLLAWLLIRAKIGAKSFKYSCVFCMVLCPIMRAFAVMHPPWNIYLSHLRMDALAFGVLLSYLHHFEQKGFDSLCRKPLLLLMIGVELVLLGLCLAPGPQPFGFVAGYTAVYLGYGCILMHALSTAERKEWLYKLVCKIGFYSYSIYLWHKAVNYSVKYVMDLLFHRVLPQEVNIALYLCFAVIWGMLMAKLIEMPLLRLRDHLFPYKLDSALLTVE